MAESLKNAVGEWAVKSAVLLSALAFASMAAGQSLSDPTRPPASFGNGQEDNLHPVASGPVLQSVLISQARKVAIISGQTVSLGESFGDARVVKITESEVTLSGRNGVLILKLFPGVEKNLASSLKDHQADNSRRQ